MSLIIPAFRGILASGLSTPSLQLSANSILEGATPNSVIGTLSVINHSSGASGWTFTETADLDAKFNISSASLRTSGTWAYTPSTTSHSVTITASKSGQTDIIKTFSVNVLAVLGNLALDSYSWIPGTPASGNITGAHDANEVITLTGTWPTGLTIDSAARTWAYDGTGTDSTGTGSLTGTHPQATNSPHVTSGLGWTLADFPPVSATLIADGDSITEGVIANNAPYPTQLAAITGLTVHNYASAGETIASRIANYDTSYIPGSYNATTCFDLIFLAGINDIRLGDSLSDIQTRIQAYCAKGQGSGYNVIVGTLLPANDALMDSSKQIILTAYNTWLRANWPSFCNGLIDYDTLGLDTESLYDFQDKLHPTNYTAWRMADLIRSLFGLSAGSDTTPSAFSFTDVTGASTSSTYTSDEITISGFTAPAAISITGGTYSINGGSFTSSIGTIEPYSKVRVRQTSSASDSTATNCVLTIGGISDTYTVTTAAPVPAFSVFNTTPVVGTATFSNGDATTLITNATSTVLTVAGASGSDKKLFAVTVDAHGGGFDIIGLHNGAVSSGDLGRTDANGVGYFTNQLFYPTNSIGPAWPSNGGNIGVAVDCVNGMMWVTVDGVNYYGGSGSPQTAAQIANGATADAYLIGAQALSTGTLYGAVGSFSGASGQFTVIAWPWSVPSGFTPL